MVGNIVCLVNRTSRPLTYVKNGRQYSLAPGDNWVNSDHVRFAKQQNPVMGSKDPYNLHYNTLVGLRATHPKDQKDELSPISDEELAMLPKEVLDRSKLPLDRQNADEIRAPHASSMRGRIGVEAPTESMRDPGKFGGTD